jgi:hypothetical protein
MRTYWNWRRARKESYSLTFDKCFGELAWRAGLPASSGIVLFPSQLQLKSELFLPQELANKLIGPDTSPSLNQGVSACAHWGHNRT